MKSVFCSFLAAGLLLLASCSSTSPSTTAMKTQEELLAGTVSKTWDMVSNTSDAGTDVTAQVALSFTFNRDSTALSSRTPSGATRAQTETAAWQIKNNILTINGLPPMVSPTDALKRGGQPFTIEELTQTSLKLKTGSGSARTAFKPR
jgi:hypothetical protein